MLTSALIGHTGFVGAQLRTSGDWGSCYASADIAGIRGRRFGSVVCAAPQARKWWANQHPKQDRDQVEGLIGHLEHVAADRFILISTVDVFPEISGVDEGFDCRSRPNHAYGENRLRLEEFAASHFRRCHVVRLPGLFGPGLKKNAIFDLCHDNQLERINPDSSFQWYDVTRLAGDLDRAARAELPLVVLATEPVKNAEIRERFFPAKEIGAEAAPAVHYDVRTRHAAVFGGSDGYLRSREAVLEDLGQYLGALGRGR